MVRVSDVLSSFEPDWTVNLKVYRTENDHYYQNGNWYYVDPIINGDIPENAAANNYYAKMYQITGEKVVEITAVRN